MTAGAPRLRWLNIWAHTYASWCLLQPCFPDVGSRRSGQLQRAADGSLTHEPLCPSPNSLHPSLHDQQMPPKKQKEEDEAEALTRIAIIDDQKCKPKKCAQECMKFCPVVRMGKLCVEVTPSSKIATISEELCIGCGICVKKCPFGAIQIINLPKDMAKQTTHRYGPNTFKLHRMPVPRPGQVLGLVGSNGTGKSTALKVLAGKMKPNLGRFDNPPDWREILEYFRGSELQNFFTRILEDSIKAIIKPQYVDHIPRAIKGIVGEILTEKNENQNKDFMLDILDLSNVLGRGISDLSGMHASINPSTHVCVCVCECVCVCVCVCVHLCMYV